MKKWHFRTTKQAQQDIDNLDGSVKERILKKLSWMMDNFNKISPLPLSGDWEGFFKYRVGDYRIIYEVDEQGNEVIIHHVDRRKDVYDL